MTHRVMNRQTPDLVRGLALAVGVLLMTAPLVANDWPEWRGAGRTGVWTEPEMLDKAVYEFADVEKMVDAAESLYGPYRWGRYDMIVLPPAFPYGGMENPVMTFLTPTFIAGDKSNNGLVAHELAHSWSGNLVTNAVWGDGWLNEGVTSYFENRIVEEVYGKKRAEQEAALAFANIEETLAEVGRDAPGTALHNDGSGELIGSAIAYDKGAYFLRTVESIVGRERFDAWLRGWIIRKAGPPFAVELDASVAFAALPVVPNWCVTSGNPEIRAEQDNFESMVQEFCGKDTSL